MPRIKLDICPCVTQEFLAALNENGVHSVTDFILSDVELLAARCSLSYQSLLVMRRLLLAQYSAFPISGEDLYNYLLSSISILSTGSHSLDEMLDGGVYAGELTEIAGDIASGKTQICFTMAALVVMETTQTVLYLDTSGSFTAERVEEILLQRGCQDMTSALNSIKCSKIFDIYNLFEVLEEVKTQLIKKSDSFYSCLRLIVVDNVTSVLSPVLGGLQSEGHSLLSQLSESLRMISQEFSCAILMTNSLVSTSSFDHPSVALGRSWQFAPHTRFLIENTRSPTHPIRRALLMKSSRAAVGSQTHFSITTKGCEDVN